MAENETPKDEATKEPEAETPKAKSGAAAKTATKKADTAGTGEKKEAAKESKPKKEPKPPKEPKPKKPIDPTQPGIELLLTRYISALLEFLRKLFTPGTYDTIAKWVTYVGNWALILSAPLGLLVSLFLAIVAKEWSVLLYGVAWVVAVPILQFVAHKFRTAGDTLVKSSPTRLSSASFLDCYALIGILVVLAFVVLGIVSAIQQVSFVPLLTDLYIAILAGFAVWLAFNPAMLNIEVGGDAGAGQEAIGIISFFVKSVVKLIPFIFGAGAVIGAVILLVDCVAAFTATPLEAFAYATTAVYILIFAALAPFIAYLAFLFTYLAIDFIRSVLEIPRKLDK